MFCKKKNVSVGETVVKFHNIQKCSGHLLVNVNNGMEKRHWTSVEKNFLAKSVPDLKIYPHSFNYFYQCNAYYFPSK